MRVIAPHGITIRGALRSATAPYAGRGHIDLGSGDGRGPYHWASRVFSVASLANRGKNAPALNAKDIEGGHSLGPRNAIVKIGGAAERIGEIGEYR
jgi:hypothetical protein